ncbi:MAG TPA: hypothetical protein VLF19_05255 [Methylomirabilota bacterium]|nr:hypothetical protein [Methylomirabilota bacterium]
MEPLRMGLVRAWVEVANDRLTIWRVIPIVPRCREPAARAAGDQAA